MAITHGFIGHTRRVAITGLVLVGGLTACGDRNVQSDEPDQTSVDVTDELATAYNDLADKNKACLNEDGAACFDLGAHYESDLENATLSAEMRQIQTRKVAYHYKLSCDYGHQPGCDAFDRLFPGRKP